MPAMTDERKKAIFEELFQLLKPNQTVAKALSELKVGIFENRFQTDL